MDNKQYLRFTLNERIQHMIIFLTFVLLFLTGFSLKYGTTETAGFLIRLMGGMENRTLLHRIGAIGLMAVGLYHILYMLLTARGRDQGRAIMLRKADFGNIATGMKNLFARTQTPISAGRYTTRQKIQYWLVFLGSASMGVSGLLMWFHDRTIAMFSKWFWDLMLVIHSQESMLIFLVILIWHLYDVHLRDAFPMDGSWLHGRMSLDRLKQNHPAEYERIVKEGEIKDA